MQNLLVDLTVSMSEFKMNPAAALRQADGRPVAVLNHNRVSFYMLGPHLFEAMLRELTLARQAGQDIATEGGHTATTAAPHGVIATLLNQSKPGAEEFGTMQP